MATGDITFALSQSECDAVADAVDAQAANLERRATDKRTPAVLSTPLKAAAESTRALAAKVRGTTVA